MRKIGDSWVFSVKDILYIYRLSLNLKVWSLAWFNLVLIPPNEALFPVLLFAKWPLTIIMPKLRLKPTLNCCNKTSNSTDSFEFVWHDHDSCVLYRFYDLFILWICGSSSSSILAVLDVVYVKRTNLEDEYTKALVLKCNREYWF